LEEPVENLEFRMSLRRWKNVLFRQDDGSGGAADGEEAPGRVFDLGEGDRLVVVRRDPLGFAWMLGWARLLTTMGKDEMPATLIGGFSIRRTGRTWDYLGHIHDSCMCYLIDICRDAQLD
jgi:hypothetical protein